MRDKISILEATKTQDTHGEEILTWTAIVPSPIAAHYMPKGGREFEKFNQIEAEIDAIFRIRYREGIKPTMRVLFNGETQNIKIAIPEDSKRKMLLLHCTRRVDGES